MLTTGFVLGILVGFLRGGSLRPFARLKLRGVWLIFVTFLVQAWMRIGGFGGAYAGLLYGATYAALTGFVWVNRRHWQLVVLGVGMLSNATVIWANGGKMPVDLEAYAYATGTQALTAISDPTHVALDAATRLPWLADIWALPPQYPLSGVFSAGDVLVSAGIFLLFQGVMLQNKKRRAAAHEDKAA